MPQSETAGLLRIGEPTEVLAHRSILFLTMRFTINYFFGGVAMAWKPFVTISSLPPQAFPKKKATRKLLVD